MPLTIILPKKGSRPMGESYKILKEPGPKPHRIRASKACQYCRSRKVRCDWNADGNPCTNCRLDNRDCVTVPRKPQVNRARKTGKGRRRKVKTQQFIKEDPLPTPSPSEISETPLRSLSIPCEEPTVSPVHVSLSDRYGKLPN
jgi:hypothetical protein